MESRPTSRSNDLGAYVHVRTYLNPQTSLSVKRAALRYVRNPQPDSHRKPAAISQLTHLPAHSRQADYQPANHWDWAPILVVLGFEQFDRPPQDGSNYVRTYVRMPAWTLQISKPSQINYVTLMKTCKKRWNHTWINHHDTLSCKKLWKPHKIIAKWMEIGATHSKLMIIGTINK